MRERNPIRARRDGPSRLMLVRISFEEVWLMILRRAFKRPEPFTGVDDIQNYTDMIDRKA